jgi:hypothetical protein
MASKRPHLRFHMRCASHAGGPVSNDLCSECTWAVRALKDLMCDPGVEGNVVSVRSRPKPLIPQAGTSS